MLQKILVHIWLIIIFLILFFFVYLWVSYYCRLIKTSCSPTHISYKLRFSQFRHLQSASCLSWRNNYSHHKNQGTDRFGVESTWCWIVLMQKWKNYPSPMWWIPKWQNCVIQEQNKRYWQQKNCSMTMRRYWQMISYSI